LGRVKKKVKEKKKRITMKREVVSIT